MTFDISDFLVIYILKLVFLFPQYHTMSSSRESKTTPK